MSVQILEDNDGRAVFYCSTTDWAFGPVFPSREAAELFLETYPQDPRSLTDAELLSRFNEFTQGYICECGNLRNEDHAETSAFRLRPEGCMCDDGGGCEWCKAKEAEVERELEPGVRFVCVYCEAKKVVKRG
jgi:hypothetical protein